MATRSNVVKLAHRAKVERHTSSKSADENEAVIRAAVTYAQGIGAFHGGFAADPSGNNETAASLGGRYGRQSAAALAELARLKATTAPAGDQRSVANAAVPLADVHRCGLPAGGSIEATRCYSAGRSEARRERVTSGKLQKALTKPSAAMPAATREKRR
jgi:hypothetical protein